jgi:integrase
MFIEAQRMTKQGSKIKVIDPNHYLEFLSELTTNQSMPLWFKAFLAVAVSGGCRVSEALELKVGVINSQGQFMVRVLKKNHKKQDKNKDTQKKDRYRQCQLCPDALLIVQEYILIRNLTPFEKLFNKNRSTIHRQIKKHFGELASAHSIARHSHISWLLHGQKLHVAYVAAEMDINSHVIDLYNHANVGLVQSERFKKIS